MSGFFEDKEDWELEDSDAKVLSDFNTDSQSGPEPEESDLSQVDARLEIAMYYRELLRSPLFEENSPASSIVSQEVRDFVKGRLATLMGFGTTSTPTIATPLHSQFSNSECDRVKDFFARFGEPEIHALELITTKLIKKPSLIDDKNPPPPRQPTVKPAVAPVASKTVRGGRTVVSTRTRPWKPPTPPTTPGPKTEVGPNGETVAVIGNRKYIKADSLTEPGKKYVKDVTPPTINPLSIPMPQGKQAWLAVTSQAAAGDLDASSAQNDIIQKAISKSITNPAPSST